MFATTPGPPAWGNCPVDDFLQRPTRRHAQGNPRRILTGARATRLPRELDGTPPTHKEPDSDSASSEGKISRTAKCPSTPLRRARPPNETHRRSSPHDGVAPIRNTHGRGAAPPANQKSLLTPMAVRPTTLSNTAVYPAGHRATEGETLPAWSHGAYFLRTLPPLRLPRVSSLTDYGG